jgi:hypothetical protein
VYLAGVVHRAALWKSAAKSIEVLRAGVDGDAMRVPVDLGRGRRARRSSGHVLDDQHRRLLGAIVTNIATRNILPAPSASSWKPTARVALTAALVGPHEIPLPAEFEPRRTGAPLGDVLLKRTE